MKRRSLEPETLGESPVHWLCKALLAIEQVEDMQALLRDLCTPAELEALADRWQVVPYVLEGVPYREIHDRTAVSVTTIGRVARCLTAGSGGYRAAVRQLKQRGTWPHIERSEGSEAVQPNRSTSQASGARS